MVTQGVWQGNGKTFPGREEQALATTYHASTGAILGIGLCREIATALGVSVTLHTCKEGMKGKGQGI